jgi:hypothetical protein
MPTYRVCFTPSHDTPVPIPIESLLQVAAENPIDAIRLALSQSPDDPLIGDEQLWARVIVGTLPDGNLQALAVPLTKTAEIPVDWSLPDKTQPS